MTCTWCGQSDDSDQTHWTFDANTALWWHTGCRREVLERIAEQMIKERHDGATTRNHRRRSASG
jgi:hypothetical protein